VCGGRHIIPAAGHSICHEKIENEKNYENKKIIK
jgi:hypothetical protein